MNLPAPAPLYTDHATRDDRLDRRSPRSREYRELMAEHERTVQHMGFLLIVTIPLIVGLAWGYTGTRDRLAEVESQLALITATMAARDVLDAQWDCKLPPTMKGDIKTCIRVAARPR